MSKSRIMTAGAGGTGQGVLTSCNQGGGDKKQGLVTTTNTRVALNAHIRIRGGGHNRNWIFCMNQLGGVGQRWGQAAGPGNRGGVSLECHALAHRRKKQYPPKPRGANVRGWGAGVKWPAWREGIESLTLETKDMNIWAIGISTVNYNGPVTLIHPYFFYQDLKDKEQIGLHCPPGVQFSDSKTPNNPVKVLANKLSLDMELNTLPNGGQSTQPCASCHYASAGWEIPGNLRFPYDNTGNSGAGFTSHFWKDIMSYDDINGKKPSRIKRQTVVGSGSVGLSMNTSGQIGVGHYPGIILQSPTARGYSYYGRVWKLWGDPVSVSDPNQFGQYGNPSSFLTTVTNKIGTDTPYNTTSRYNLAGNRCPPPQLQNPGWQRDSCLSATPTTKDCSFSYAQTSRSVQLWNSVEGGSGVWRDSPLLNPGNSFPRYRSQATSICYVNQTFNTDPNLCGQALGSLLISSTLLYDPNIGLLYTDSSGNSLKSEDTGWVGYYNICVDGTFSKGSKVAANTAKFPVDTLPYSQNLDSGSQQSTVLPTRSVSSVNASDSTYPISETQASTYIDTDSDTDYVNGVYMQFTSATKNENNWIQMPVCVEANSAQDQSSWERLPCDCSNQIQNPVDLKIDPQLLVTGYPGYVPIVLPDNTYRNFSSSQCPPSITDVPTATVFSITLTNTNTTTTTTHTIYYQYVRFMDQPAFRVLWDKTYAPNLSFNGVLPVTIADACQWQNIVTQLHNYVNSENKWPDGWRIDSPSN